MKKIILLLLITPLLVSCWPVGCDGCEDPSSYSSYEAIKMKRKVLDSSIKMKDSQEIVESSKIYIFDKFIFITDKYRGFHIFDNSNPKNPVKKKFLNVPGATDIAIRNNTLFINQATDLISVSFNPDNYSISLNKRVKNALTPNTISPDGFWEETTEDEVIVGWKLK